MQAPDDQKYKVPCGDQSSQSVPEGAAGGHPRRVDRASQTDPEPEPQPQPQQAPAVMASRRSVTVEGRFRVRRVMSPEPSRHVRFAPDVLWVGGRRPEESDPEEGPGEAPRERRMSRWNLFRKNLKLRSPPRPPAPESDDE